MVLFSLVAIAVVGVVFLLLKGLSFQDRPEAVLAVLGSELGDSRLSAIHHVAKRDGVQEWTLDAESARYETENNRAVLEKVSVTFFIQDGDPVHVTGAEGVLYTDTMNIDVSGNVVVSAGSRELKTRVLHYDHDRRSVFTDTPVVITDEGIRLAGNSMRFSLAKQEGALWGDVEAVLSSPEWGVAGS